jgi:hypothetical protein
VDASGNEGPPSDPIKAKTEHTSLKPLIVSGMELQYDGSKAVVSLQVADLKTGEAIGGAKVSGRFTYMAGKYVNGTAAATGFLRASSENVSSPSGEIGFAPRRITAPGYYWAQAYDRKGDASVRWGN